MGFVRWVMGTNASCVLFTSLRGLLFFLVGAIDEEDFEVIGSGKRKDWGRLKVFWKNKNRKVFWRIRKYLYGQTIHFHLVNERG